MSKFCPNCGKELDSSFNVCPNCGTPTNNTNNTVINNNYYSNNNAPVVTKREIVVSIILSIITCGIYGIYWFVVMTDDANKVSGNTTPSGGAAFLFTLLTCGIYSIYWNYKMGQKMAQAGKMYNKDISDNSVVYLILSLFGLSIINYCLIQSDLNKFAEQWITLKK